jgi:hypothetical protein
MIHLIGEVVVGIVTRIILYLFLMPIYLALATPFVLVAAPFHKGGVRGGYRAVLRAYDWTYFIA